MQRVVEKTNKNTAAKRGREQGVFHKLPDKQMKAPFEICADFESSLRKIHGCDLPKLMNKVLP